MSVPHFLSVPTRHVHRQDLLWFLPLHLVIITHHVRHRTSFRIGIPIISRIRSSPYICRGAPLLFVSSTRQLTGSPAISRLFMSVHAFTSTCCFAFVLALCMLLQYLFPSSSTADHLFVSHRHTSPRLRRRLPLFTVAFAIPRIVLGKSPLIMFTLCLAPCYPVLVCLLFPSV